MVFLFLLPRWLPKLENWGFIVSTARVSLQCFAFPRIPLLSDYRATDGIASEKFIDFFCIMAYAARFALRNAFCLVAPFPHVMRVISILPTKYVHSYFSKYSIMFGPVRVSRFTRIPLQLDLLESRFAW